MFAKMKVVMTIYIISFKIILFKIMSNVKINTSFNENSNFHLSYFKKLAPSTILTSLIL